MEKSKDYAKDKKNGLIIPKVDHIVNGMAIFGLLLIGKIMDMRLSILLMKTENYVRFQEMDNIILTQLAAFKRITL